AARLATPGGLQGIDRDDGGPRFVDRKGWSARMIREITHYRVCGSAELASVLDLGSQALTGVFPKKKSEAITSGPLELVKCQGGCGLVQLRQSYDMSELYGANYGYRSGLNPSMVRHLQAKVQRILQADVLASGDLVVDIGSNDGT